MKFLILITGLLLSLNSFASDQFLKCDLFENDQLVRSVTEILDENGDANVDLGMLDIYAFGGFAWNGYPGTFIMSAAESKKSNSTTDSVTSTTGSILTITCDIE